MKALIKITAKYRPYSGDISGFRILAAIPNTAAKKMVKTSKGFRATSEDVPSFSAPYLIRESMDFARPELISRDEVSRFKANLNWSGFTSFEFIKQGGESGKKLSPEAQKKIDKMLVDLGFLV